MIRDTVVVSLICVVLVNETIGNIESGIGVSALMIIHNCSAICKTNPSVIVQPYESASVGQPERFGVGCCACTVSVEIHR
jgi:hypothetical protein